VTRSGAQATKYLFDYTIGIDGRQIDVFQPNPAWKMREWTETFDLQTPNDGNVKAITYTNCNWVKNNRAVGSGPMGVYRTLDGVCELSLRVLSGSAI